MFYRDLNIPSVIEMGDGLFGRVNELLLRNHIYYKYKILVTQKDLLGLYRDCIDEKDYSQIIEIRGGEYDEIKEINISFGFADVLLVAFGGGSVIDFVKILAKETGSAYLSIPSTLSNDAIYSPIARLNVNGKKQSFGVQAPLGIIVDTSIIRKSPVSLLLAGVGDLISNLSAIQDCELAEKYNEEKIDSFAISLSQLSANSILSFTKQDIYTARFIEQLANGLIVSGLSMVMCKSSRPASGAEHLISHAIDEFYSSKSTLHGIQVAWAQLLLEKKIRKNQSNYLFLRAFFERIGLMDIINSEIGFKESDFLDILPQALNIRKRFTVLDIWNGLPGL